MPTYHSTTFWAKDYVQRCGTTHIFNAVVGEKVAIRVLKWCCVQGYEIDSYLQEEQSDGNKDYRKKSENAHNNQNC